ncbi:uncharacterized protein LOC111883397 isoform X3 [Lactuca sativa]|uniref:uncharacterized protein LOC111883397 isoform X3 n=1 Tax=Lactuca sativa TaxID=4236 RepID=UPI001C693CC7|nr:uncharacterized protein LOC111883397 isoform X3 [Lactuca sativa]
MCCPRNGREIFNKKNKVKLNHATLGLQIGIYITLYSEKTEVLGGVRRSFCSDLVKFWIYTMDASNFWEIMDTNEITKDDIVLLTRYLVDSYRTNGFRLPADNFFKEAKIEQVGELKGSYVDYHEPCMKQGAGVGLWIFFCQEILKHKGVKERPRLMRHNEDTSQTTTNQQPVNADQDHVFTFPCHERPWLITHQENTSQSQTTTNQQVVNVDPDHGTISGAKQDVLRKLFRYVYNYFNKNMLLADCFVQKEETAEEEASVFSICSWIQKTQTQF